MEAQKVTISIPTDGDSLSDTKTVVSEPKTLQNEDRDDEEEDDEEEDDEEENTGESKLIIHSEQIFHYLNLLKHALNDVNSLLGHQSVHDMEEAAGGMRLHRHLNLDQR